MHAECQKDILRKELKEIDAVCQKNTSKKLKEMHARCQIACVHIKAQLHQ